MEDLEPGASYAYRVEAGDVDSGGPLATAAATFATAPPPGEGPVRFLVVGDNRTDAQAHAAVIARMRDHPGDFVLNTGDMVARGNDPEDWQEYFDVERELLADTPLFPAMGNHEIYRFGVGLPNFLRYTRVPDTHESEETYYAFDWGTGAGAHARFERRLGKRGVGAAVVARRAPRRGER